MKFTLIRNYGIIYEYREEEYLSERNLKFYRFNNVKQIPTS
jgi:hypothetical protein